MTIKIHQKPHQILAPELFVRHGQWQQRSPKGVCPSRCAQGAGGEEGAKAKELQWGIHGYLWLQWGAKELLTVYQPFDHQFDSLVVKNIYIAIWKKERPILHGKAMEE